MSIVLRKVCFLMLSAAAALFVAQSALGQRPHEWTPFIDPLQFDPDFQFFAPADLGDFGHPDHPQIGWFAQYNRMYIYVTRPENELSRTDGDFTWGNRFDVGYMTDENRGWWVSGMHIDGPHAYDILVIPRINRDNPDDRDTPGAQQPNPPIFPPQDRNDVITGSRDFRRHISLNVARLSGFELNRVWRLDPLHYGGVLEPFVGFRYNKFHDHTRRDSYRRFDPTTGFPSSPFPNDTDTVEEIINDLAWWDNNLVGGQLGIRWSEQKSRWLLSSDLRVFAAENFQSFSARRDTLQILYGGVGTDSDVTTELVTRTGTASHDAEFVFGFDVRAEAAFELTRDISLTTGVQVLHFARGIARGNIASHNDEDLTMVGATFGINVNR